MFRNFVKTVDSMLSFMADKLTERRFKPAENFVDIRWNDTFKAKKDGMCLLSVRPSSASGYIVVNENSNVTVFQATFTNADPFRRWFPVVEGSSYEFIGKYASEIKVKLMYFNY